MHTNPLRITLRQGLDDFYEQYASQLSHTKEGLPEEVKAFFTSHDIAHVLFDCDISLYGEGKVKFWTIFGTTMGFWKHIGAYKKADAYELARSFSLANDTWHFFRLLCAIPTLIYRSKRMNKPWPWTGFESYMDRPITEIRKEFNIEIL